MRVMSDTIRDDLPTHERVAQVYQHQKASRDSKQIKTRKDDVLLARLRFSHQPSQHHYLYRLDPTQDPIVCYAASMNKTLITGFANALLVMSQGKECLGITKGS